MISVPEIGKRYIIKHSGKMVEAELIRIDPPSHGRREHYVFRKLSTNREVLIRSRQKILVIN